MSAQTQTAVILAAGWGSRVQGLSQNGEPLSKPLIRLNNEPMVVRVIRTLAAAGITRIIAVTGYLTERVEKEVKALSSPTLSVETVFNPRWDTLANGVSLLTAKEMLSGPFMLCMSDHVFDIGIARDLIQEGSKGMAVRLCIDRKLETIFDMDDATKVLTQGERIVDIGKTIADYNAVDAGVFFCETDILQSLDAVLEAKGDCSLSDGMKRLGQSGRFGYLDIGSRIWQDVDTPETLRYAEKLLADGLIHFPN